MPDAAASAQADFFERLAAHWKAHYPGWTAWLLSPDMQLPQRMRLQASRRIPLWNGPLECRLFRFDMVAGRMAGMTKEPQPQAADAPVLARHAPRPATPLPARQLPVLPQARGRARQAHVCGLRFFRFGPCVLGTPHIAHISHIARSCA